MAKFSLKFLFLLLFSLFCINPLFSFSVSPKAADEIAQRIWKNECGGTIEGLTCWNQGENFASLGIGHFIWYPAGRRECFQETFPDLLTFLKSQGAQLPTWMEGAQKCPWNTREEFYRNIQSNDMQALRQFLFDTRNLQAIYIAHRLENALPDMIKNLPEGERSKVASIFSSLSADPKGLYALIDYSNFKGIGISPEESYQSQGWGLLQVLLRIQPDSKNILNDFVESAKIILTQRVKNSPAERNEQKWLNGWLKRVNTYLE